MELSRWRERRLAADFFARPTVEVARALLGATLVHELPTGVRAGQVVETEAYVGQNDLGSHARHGRTSRNWPMFGPPGRAYVYFIYGMHHCLNVVTEADDRPAAVLIRAVACGKGLAGPARGPGLVCRALEIDRSFNGADLTVPPLYFVEPELPLADERVAAGPRVGIDYAGRWAELPWRFWIAESPAVSRPRTRPL